jgi:hypothetical protein
VVHGYNKAVTVASRRQNVPSLVRLDIQPVPRHVASSRKGAMPPLPPCLLRFYSLDEACDAATRHVDMACYSYSDSFQSYTRLPLCCTWLSYICHLPSYTNSYFYCTRPFAISSCPSRGGPRQYQPGALSTSTDRQRSPIARRVCCLSERVLWVSIGLILGVRLKRLEISLYESS